MNIGERNERAVQGAQLLYIVTYLEGLHFIWSFDWQFSEEHFSSVPKCHKGKVKEKSKSASELGDQRLEGVEQGLQLVGGDVP